jgi:spore germination protein GerM
MARRRQSVQLTVYFPSRRYVESGDETLPRLVAETVELDVADAGASVDTLARALLAALEAGPKSAAATQAIPERLVIRQVHVRDGVAYVDFSRAGLSGGSLEEALLVKTIVRTLAGVPQVRAVQFLVEGKTPETLMGHVTTTKPISVTNE